MVASRHCPVFFVAPPRRRSSNEESDNDSDDDDEGDAAAEPDYATLVALGGKSGFVTIWSTKSCRPLFKMQCSESRCTVTDIAWGYDPKCKDSLVLLVSLLDGYVVGLNFDIPTEVGGGHYYQVKRRAVSFNQSMVLKTLLEVIASLRGINTSRGSVW